MGSCCRLSSSIPSACGFPLTNISSVTGCGISSPLCTAHRSMWGLGSLQSDHALFFQLASWTPWPHWGWQHMATASAMSLVSSIRRLLMAGRYIDKLKLCFLLLFYVVVATSACGQALATQTALKYLELFINWAFGPITSCQLGCQLLPLVLTPGSDHLSKEK